MARLVVLASGAGTLFQSLIDAAAKEYPARIVGLVVDRPCAAEDRARAAGLPIEVVRMSTYPDRATWDKAMTAATERFEPDLVVTAGFMKLLGPAFLARFSGRVINSHPALLPSFPGTRAVRDALDYGVKVTGTTVHLVDGGVDTGPILAQEAVPVLADDDEASLHERIKVVERRLLVEIVAAAATRGVISDGRKAVIP